MTVLIIIIHLILYYFLFEKAEQPFYKNLHWLWILIPLLFIFLDLFIIIKQTLKKNHSLLAGTLFLLLLIPIFLILGHLSWKHAFQDCIENSEKIRNEILDYYKEHSKYPIIPKKAPRDYTFPFSSCGGRFLNGPLLQYEKTETGFKIFFSDNLVTYIGTESNEVTEFK